MTELFHTDETLSPRLEWMRLKLVRTKFYPVETMKPWRAWSDIEPEMGPMYYGDGATEDEAITALAKLMGWQLWNEEGLK